MKKSVTIAVLILSLLISGTFALTSCSKQGEEAADAVKTPVTANPLTGQKVEDGFDEAALDQRIVAFVVENAPDARPQWGMDDPNYSPDIVLEGEVEGGITRTLWMYADYNKLPEIIGPMRSARPPYIRFSELFDSVFIHWGQSGSKGEYVGASTVFRKDKVDHINQMTFNDTVGLFSRDHSRSVSSEHRGILYGDKVPSALDASGFRDKPEEYTRLNFSALGNLSAILPAENVYVTYSERTGGFNTEWKYNAEDNMYHTSDFRNDFTRDNLLILYDSTEYIDKPDYSGQGYTLTYCDYKLAGGKGMLMSRGRSKEIEWKIEDGKLILTDTAATRTARARAEAAAAEDEKNGKSQEAEDTEPITVNASLMPGKTWIGWISENNGGGVEIRSAENN